MHHRISTCDHCAYSHLLILSFTAIMLALLPAMAQAQTANPQLGGSGVLVLSAERLFGVVSSTTSMEQMGVEASATTTSIDVGLRQSASPWSVPRLAFDGFVTDGLSLGAAAGFSTSSFSAGASSGGTDADVDLGSSWTLVLSPRVGYAYMFSEKAGIWPRAGMSFFFGGFGIDDGLLAQEDLDGDGMPDVELTAADSSVDGIALSAELPLILTPAQHFIILIAPTLDLGLTGSVSADGSASSDSSESDIEVTDFGLQVGLGGWF